MLSAEGTGKTIEKAIESALLELKAPREDVDIKILSEGGLFKKAKVQVTISDDAKEKYIKREKLREKIDEKFPEKEESKKENLKKIEETKSRTVEENYEILRDRLDNLKKERSEIKTGTVEDQVVKETVKEKEVKKEKVVDPIAFLQGFFKTLNKVVEITALEDDKFITYSVNGEDLGEVIGRRGEAYYALSKLFLAVIGKQEKKALLDIAGYREKREESLSAVAKRTADKVAKSGRYIKLEPMKPSERRIIHTALQDDDRVTTLSKGTEPHRYVIIFPKEYKDK